MQIFGAYFSSSFEAEISERPPLQTVGTPFTNFWKGVPTICKRGPNDIFALKDKENYVLKIGMGSFFLFSDYYLSFLCKTCLEWQK